MSYRHKKAKTLKKIGRKMTKLGLEFGSVEEREREKSFLKSMKQWRIREKLILKNSLNNFWSVEN